MDETLEHHGIKGMKWGVRRTPEQLGHQSSKRQVKKAIKQARIANGGRFQSNVGPRTAAVQKKHEETLNKDEGVQKGIKRVQETSKKMHEAYDRKLMAEDYQNRLHNDETASRSRILKADRESEAANEAYEKASIASYNASQNLHSHETRIAKQFVKQYETAAIKDLGFEDVKTGRAVLNKYGLMNKAIGATMGTGLRYE